VVCHLYDKEVMANGGKLPEKLEVDKKEANPAKAAN